MITLQKTLIPSLKAVIKGKANNYEVNIIVKAAQQFATIRLLQIIKKHQTNIEIYPHNISSIALDMIADLFHRDEEGKFIEISEYFTEERDIEKLNDEAILDAFRIIIFSKLNDGVIRLYREKDPILAKIIRNLKIEVKKSEHFYLLERFGDIYIAPKDICLDEECEPFPIDNLEKEICLNTTRIKSGDFLKSIFTLLIESGYRKFYSLMDVAFIMKRIYSRHSQNFQSMFILDKDLYEFDINSIVRTCLGEIETSLRQKYVENKKIEEKIFIGLIAAIDEFITRTYIYTDGHDLSHYDYIKNHMPLVSYEEYRKNYRIYFEYMTKIAKQKVENNLKELLY